ncbi:MAG: class I SAM-dependent methyltransferase [Paracoccaceae bacterium]|nr:class I SAM-dependent methyltransferase [Paracoccaceae bacterium]
MSEMDGYWERLAAPWLRHEAAMEALLEPVGAALDAALGLSDGEAVLDVGPGSGASLLRHCAAVGDGGRVVGIDIAPPFAARARVRSGVEVVVADAGAAPVEPAGFDAVTSQFGMMFFADPAAAFGEVGRNLRPGGRLVFVAWGPRAQNPLFSVAGQVAAEMFGPAAPVDPDAPGPFGLQNASRATALLAEAGFAEVAATSVGLTLDAGLDAAGFARVQTEVGPAASRLKEEGQGEARHAEMLDRLTAAFADYESGGAVRLPAMVHVYAGVWGPT